MAYIGAVRNVDFMQVDGEIFAFVLGRWCPFCRVYEWFETLPGRLLRRVFFSGRHIRLK